MTNPFYSASGSPGTGTPGASATMRSEFLLVQAAFDKLPALSPAGAAVIINGGGTAMTTTTGALALAGNLTTTGAFNTTLAQSASVTLTLPGTSQTLATLAGTEIFTNKTFDTAGTGNVFKINGTAITAKIGTGSVVLATAASDATKFLNGAATPAFAAVKESDLAFTDVTSNDVSITAHGFAPKAPNDATKFLNGANPPAYAVPTSGAVAASQAEEEAASSTTVYTSPGRQHFHPGSAKCWAQVVVSAGTPTLTTSYNITSITDSATGAMIITIATDFSSANWCALALGAKATGGGAEANQRKVMVGAPVSIAPGTIALVCYDDTVTTNLLADPEQWYFAGFGDQA
jgi:hypothetical protein